MIFIITSRKNASCQNMRQWTSLGRFLAVSSTSVLTASFIGTSNLLTFFSRAVNAKSVTLDSPRALKVNMPFSNLLLARRFTCLLSSCKNRNTQTSQISGQSALSSMRCCMEKHHGWQAISCSSSAPSIRRRLLIASSSLTLQGTLSPSALQSMKQTASAGKKPLNIRSSEKKESQHFPSSGSSQSPSMIIRAWSSTKTWQETIWKTIVQFSTLASLERRRRRESKVFA